MVSMRHHGGEEGINRGLQPASPPVRVLKKPGGLFLARVACRDFLFRCAVFALFFSCFFICVLTRWAAVFTSAFAMPLRYEGIGINIAGEPGCLKPPRLRCLPVG